MHVTGQSYGRTMSAAQPRRRERRVAERHRGAGALAAAAGPEFLREVRAGGTPSSVGHERRVLERPSADRMHPIVTQYVSYWVDRLGGEATSRVILSIFKL